MQIIQTHKAFIRYDKLIPTVVREVGFDDIDPAFMRASGSHLLTGIPYEPREAERVEICLLGGQRFNVMEDSVNQVLQASGLKPAGVHELCSLAKYATELPMDIIALGAPAHVPEGPIDRLAWPRLVSEPEGFYLELVAPDSPRNLWPSDFVFAGVRKFNRA